MQFSCAQCSTKYAVPDDKVRGKRIRTKCRKCGAEIVVDGPGAPGAGGSGAGAPPVSKPPSAPLSAPLSAPPSVVPRSTSQPPTHEVRWTVAIDRTNQQKLTTNEIADAFSRGVVSDRTLAWKQGMDSWLPLADIPTIALALKKKAPVQGLDDVVTSVEPPDLAKLAASAKAGWDDENEATRVVESALQFPNRPAAPVRPAPLPAPAPAPAVRVSAGAPTAAAAPQGGPAPRRAFAKTQLGLAAPPPPVPPPPKTLPVPEAPPPAPPAAQVAPVSAPSPSMDFDDEATAVIAPDRARELLDEEVKKSRPTQAKPEPPAETPLSFGFDDEATLVVAPERADQLLGKDKRPAPVVVPPPAPVPAASPPPAAQPAPAARKSLPPAEKSPLPVPVPAAGRPAEKDDRRSKAGVEGGPSVVLSEPKSKPPSPRDFAHEPTRVVRVRKKSNGAAFWVMLTLALLAAGIGGFVASRLADGQPLPWTHPR